MSYRMLYELPCRLPCDRYASANNPFQGEVILVAAAVPPPSSAPAPKPSKPTPAAEEKKEKFDGGEYEPSVSREAYEYEPTTESFDYGPFFAFMAPPKAPGEGYEYEPTTESYTGNADGDCGCSGPAARGYRMETCGYNTSPTWDQRQVFTKEGFTADVPVDSADCGCSGPKGRGYRVETCGYNTSPTWQNQAQFRANTQDRF